MWPLPLAAGLMTGCVLAAPGPGVRRTVLWIPVVCGIVLALFGLLVTFAAAVRGGGALLALSMVAAGSVGAVLCAVHGARARGRAGIALCGAAASACAVGFLHSAVTNGGIWLTCLPDNGVAACSAVFGEALSSTYFANGGLVPLAIPALLAVWPLTCAAGSALRALSDRVRSRAPAADRGAGADPGVGVALGPGTGPDPSPAAGGTRPGPHAAVAVTVLAMALAVTGYSAVRALCPPGLMTAPQREALREQVVPAGADRDEACLAAATVYDTDSMSEQSLRQGSALVALASSDDPALAAFGRAALDGPGPDGRRFLRSVNAYCTAVGAVQGEAGKG